MLKYDLKDFFETVHFDIEPEDWDSIENDDPDDELLYKQETVPEEAEYLLPGELPPEGYELEQGPKGGHYYIPKHTKLVEIIANVSDEKLYVLRNRLDRIFEDLVEERDDLWQKRAELDDKKYSMQGSKELSQLLTDQIENNGKKLQKNQYLQTSIGNMFTLVSSEIGDRQSIVNWDTLSEKAKGIGLQYLDIETSYHLDKAMIQTLENELDIKIDSISGSTVNDRSRVKDFLISKIAEKLRDHTGIDEWEKDFPDYFYTKNREYDITNHLISVWAASSADSNIISLAIQLAAKKEFGRDSSTIEHFDEEAVEKAERLFSKHEGVLNTFLRAQYDITQDLLTKNNIKEITLFRGVAMPDLEKSDVDNIQLQPISSFSTSAFTARDFGDEIIVTNVPAKDVLSTAITGIGCLTEGEITVLGDTKPAFIHKYQKSRKGGVHDQIGEDSDKLRLRAGE